MNAIARTRDIYIQQLPNEVVMYDSTNHQAHCVSKTVFTVWQGANGSRSVDQLAELLHRDLGLPCSQDMVLLALEDLRQARLLEHSDSPAEASVPSRRDIARKLSLAGLSVSLLPFVASMSAPTPAMARSGTYTSQNYNQWYSQALSQAGTDFTEVYIENKNGSRTDLTTAIADGTQGLSALAQGNQSAAQTDFANSLGEFNAMLQALGLPPL